MSDSRKQNSNPVSVLPRKKISVWVCIIACFVILFIWLLAFYILPILFPNLEYRALWGDSFGSLNALFSGLAFAGLIYTIILQMNDLEIQRHQLELNRSEIIKSNKIQKNIYLNQQKTNAIEIHANLFIKLIEMRSGVKHGGIQGIHAINAKWIEFEKNVESLDNLYLSYDHFPIDVYKSHVEGLGLGVSQLISYLHSMISIYSKYDKEIKNEILEILYESLEQSEICLFLTFCILNDKYRKSNFTKLIIENNNLIPKNLPNFISASLSRWAAHEKALS